MSKKNLKKIIDILSRVLKEHNDAHGIALGVAAGSFIGILPLYGLHTILCLAVLFLMPRANKVAIILGTNVSLPPTVGTITWTAYDIGRILLTYKNYPPLSWEYLKKFNFSNAGEFYYPLFVGSVILGLITAAVLYSVTWIIADRFIKRHAIKK